MNESILEFHFLMLREHFYELCVNSIIDNAFYKTRIENRTLSSLCDRYQMFQVTK
jgi:hypothetical protein